MPTKQEAMTAARTLLQAQYASLNGRVLLEPWDFVTGSDFDWFKEEETFTPFVVIARDDSKRNRNTAFNDFDHTTIDEEWTMRFFVALGYGKTEIDTKSWYDICEACYTWENRIRSLFVNYSNFEDSNGAATIRQLGHSGRAFAEFLHPSLRMYSTRWWWGVTAYADVIQEV